MRKRIGLIIPLLLVIAVTWPQHTAAAPTPAPADPKASPFGMVTAFGNRVREDEMGTAVQLLKEAGVQWAREEIFWDRVQPQQDGAFVWGGPGGGMYNYDLAIGKMHSAGINVLGLLDYNPAWFKGQNPPLDAWLGEWGTYVYNTVARYGRVRGQIKYWEIWNEENLRNFGYENGLYTIQDYVRVLNYARAAIKAADPEAVIVLGGVAAIWSPLNQDHEYDVLDYLQQLHDAGGWDSFDILAIHPYRPGPPEAATWRRDTALDVEAELNAVDGLNHILGAKPIWITEVGWSNFAGTYGVSEDDQASFMVRMYLLALAHPNVQRVFWYDFRDDSAPNALYHRPVYDDHEAEYHFGLLRRSFPLDPGSADLRKPSFLAYRTMTEVLGGLTMSGILHDGNDPAMPGTWAYRYDGKGRAAVVLWRIGGATAPTLTIPCACISATVRRSDGKALALIATSGAVQVQLDMIGTPLYVEWGDDRNKTGPFFPQTGHHISSPFLDYWQTNGGLDQFGLPLSGPLTESDPQTGAARVVQYFERNRMEYNPALRNTPFAVQIGRLGDDYLRRMGVDWQTLPKQPDPPPPECNYYAETGHRLCDPFKSYWEQHGGLPIYGLPLSEAFDEQGHLVQYFERARFEWHPDKAGTPYEVELGLLGTQLYSRWGVYP
ncbi:MAG: hypothetical protein H0X37_03485 [Herpetosiphonaceae bacterium]|nr:hypothetical protein [Herpetosiphonaceae bacterium]